MWYVSWLCAALLLGLCQQAMAVRGLSNEHRNCLKADDASQSTNYSSNASRDRLLVVARYEEDITWLSLHLPDVPHLVYQSGDPETVKGLKHATLINKGNEAMAYVQFIIDYYENLPKHMVFMHAHRGAWHMKDIVPIISKLRWDSFGYASLRFSNSPGNRLDWECEGKTDHWHWKNFNCDWQAAYLRPGNTSFYEGKEVDVTNDQELLDTVDLMQMWPELLEQELGPIPPEIHGPCCSTFLVSQERILRHSKVFYENIRDWIMRTELDSYRAGRMMEHSWHMIFGESPVFVGVPECSLLYCDTETEEHQPLVDND